MAIGAKAAVMAKVAGIELDEPAISPGFAFGPWWTVISVGKGPGQYFHYNADTGKGDCVPAGTIVRMAGGQMFIQQDDMILQPITE